MNDNDNLQPDTSTTTKTEPEVNAGNLPAVVKNSEVARVLTVVTPAKLLKTDKGKTRETAFSHMSEALQAKVKQLDTFSGKLSSANLTFYWEIGALVRDASQDADKYGKAAVEQLADYFDVAPRTLYAWRDVVAIWSRQEIQQLSAQQLSNGARLTWSHLVYIASAASPKDRERILKAAYTDSLSANDVQREVASTKARHRLAAATTSMKALPGGKTGKVDAASTTVRRAGRQPSKPKSIVIGVEEIYRQLNGVTSRFENWKSAVFDEIDTVDVTRIDDTLHASLQKAMTAAEAASDSLTTICARLATNLKRVDKVIEANKKANKSKDVVPIKAAMAKPPTKKGVKPATAKKR